MIIVTRPSPEGNELTRLLNQANMPAKHLPLFGIKEGQDLPILQHELNQLTVSDIVIIVSPQVTHAIQPYISSLSFPLHARYFAVGKKSAELFTELTQRPVDYPEQEDSEGLLQRLKTTPIKNRTVLILRGNTGRELLGETLSKQKADVKFLQCYSRQPIHYPLITLSENIEQQIIIITSVENLLQLESLCKIAHKKLATLIVTSERIFNTAKQLNWQNIQLADGANNQILFKTMTTLCHNA